MENNKVGLEKYALYLINMSTDTQFSDRSLYGYNEYKYM